MEILWTFLMAAATTSAAVYAHVRLPAFSRSAVATWITRAILAGLGLVIGFEMAQLYPWHSGIAQVFAFLSGFGIVHVPAAIILFLKKQERRA